MLKGIIKAVSQDKKVILWLPEGMADVKDNQRWFKITDLALPYAKKGNAQIDMDDKNMVIKVVMDSGGSSTSNGGQGYSQAANPSSPPTYYKDREEKIIKQTCLKAAVELCCAGKIELEKIIEMANSMSYWVNSSDLPKD